MPIRKKGKQKGSINSTERDFQDALNRLISGKPRNQKLKLLAARRRLKVTIANVALEANKSRTLIGQINCSYPEIRARILELRPPRTQVKTQEDIIRDLRTENKELRQDKAMLATQLADAVSTVWRLKKQLEFQKSINKNKESAKVVQFRSRDKKP